MRFCAGRAAEFDGFDCALIEQRAVGEADVGRVPHLERRAEHQVRQTLSAVVGRDRQPDPASLGKLRVGLFEAGRRRHRAGVPAAAFDVAGAVDGVEHFACERRRFVEDRVEDVGRVLEARKFGDVVDARKFAQDELHVAQAGLGKCS